MTTEQAARPIAERALRVRQHIVEMAAGPEGAHIGGALSAVACGPHPVLAALGAADRLAADGLGATVLDRATVKPLDVQALVAAAERTGRVVTVEDHSVIGGHEELLAHFGITDERIHRTALALYKGVDEL